jgi:hypothetical protein
MKHALLLLEYSLKDKNAKENTLVTTQLYFGFCFREGKILLQIANGI